MRKVVNNNGSTDTYDYVNGVEYKNNILQRFAHTEGSVSRQDNGTYLHEYVLRDHLGNTRVTFSDANNDGTIVSTDIKQINHYYPFGMNMEGNFNGTGGKNKYQYNNKEWNDDFGLGWNDYGARFYDPALARFSTIDPLSFKYTLNSPYIYCSNNPVAYVDINGLYFSNPQDRATLDQAQKDINSKINQLTKQLEVLKTMGGTNKLISSLNSSISALKSSNSEIDMMRLDRNVSFSLAITDKPATYATSKDAVKISYDGTTGSLLHEAAHGYQYLAGEVDFIQTQDGVIPGLLYDQTDEVAAYRREFAYNQTFIGREALQDNMDISKKMSLLKNNSLTISSIHDITTNLVNKLGDNLANPLYNLIPSAYLNSSSSTSVVRESNTNRQDISNAIGLSRSNVPYGQFASKSINNQYIFVK